MTALLLAALSLAAPSPDVAEPPEAVLHPDNVVESGPDTISLHAWGRAGYAVKVLPEGVEHGPYLAMARLKARLDHEDRYGVYIHIAGDGGQLTLADAEVHATLTEGLKLAAGRMKVPVSHDFLIPVQEMLLPTRALLDRLAPSRAIGLKTTWTHTLGDTHTQARVRGGVFSRVDASFEQLGGSQLVLQGDVHAEEGLFVHGAGALWLSDEDPGVFGDDEPPWHLRGDVAVGWEDPLWTVHVEGLVARRLEPQTGRAALDGGVTGMVGRRIEVEHEHHLVLEPVAAVDVRSMAEQPMVRGTAAVNLHEDGWHLLQTLAYEAEHTHKEGIAHRVVLQLQAGI